jgi:hypothetical protein
MAIMALYRLGKSVIGILASVLIIRSKANIGCYANDKLLSFMYMIQNKKMIAKDLVEKKNLNMLKFLS